MIPAIVLAGGASTRMGRPKALLPIGRQTFVERILRTLADGGITETVVVVRPDAPQLRSVIDAVGYGRAVENVAPERGQLSSLLAGLDAVDRPSIEGVLVTLVDVPLVRPETVAHLVARAAQSSAPVLRAVHGGRHGHPVIFRRAVFQALRTADPEIGAKAILRAHMIEDVEVDDPGVLRDVDTPDDFARLDSANP